MRVLRRGLVLVLLFVAHPDLLSAGDDSLGEGSEHLAAEGYRLLLEKPFVSSALSDEEFDELWRVWPEDQRKRAAAVGYEQRRELAFARYGLTRRPGSADWKPLQYVVDELGNWHQNCFSCHGGQIDGRVTPGAPNNQYAMQTLSEEVIKLRLLKGQPLQPRDLGTFVVPMGSTNGTTNAVMFGVILMGRRDSDLNLTSGQASRLIHHDMDAPPWWNYSIRQQLYIDGFAEKGHRSLMPFLLEPDNGPEAFREWEEDFRKINAYLESVRSPEYPQPIDRDLAERGRTAFRLHCAECHGDQDAPEAYPERVIPLEEIGTDPVRLDALTPEYREGYRQSWFAEYGRSRVVTEPAGYQAPPLRGIWASPPYLHNGSIPTLWHLLHPDQRPTIWKPTSRTQYDHQKLGLPVEEVDAVPVNIADPVEHRSYFDTTRPGKSAAGHDYPARLTEEEKRAVLEYLKTL